MKNTVEVFLFVDALGWEIVRRHKFLADLLPYRQRVDMQFGYSCSAIPTILSGERPDKHGHFCLFYKAVDGKSPFSFFKYFRWLNFLFDRGRVRHQLSKLVGKLKGYDGYFQLYTVPFDHLAKLDYCEKHDIFVPGGLAPVNNLADVLLASGLNYHISNWRKSEIYNFEAARKAVTEDGAEFVFLYTAGFDGFAHDNITDDALIGGRLKWYEQKIKELYAALTATGKEVHLTVISDHGMTPLKGTFDLAGALAAAGLVWGKDFISCLDATLARFWFEKPDAADRVVNALKRAPGKWISKGQCKFYGIDFADHRYGEAIFLMDAGVQISPCDLGRKPLNGMHGFSPEDKDSYAAILSNTDFDKVQISHVADYFRLMTRRIGQLKEQA